MTVYFSHATSFCGAVWSPVRGRLTDVDTVAWDHPGHGRGPKLDLPVDWRRFGQHVLEVTEPGGIGVGPSMGAAALAMAQATDPERFRALVLIEPIIFPGPFGREERDEMASAAERRMAVFSLGFRSKTANLLAARLLKLVSWSMKIGNPVCCSGSPEWAMVTWYTA